MVTYVPILKGRRGELDALAHLAPETVAHLAPIIEVQRTEHGSAKDTSDFGSRIGDSIPRGLTVAVDVRHLADAASGQRGPMRYLAEDFERWQVPLLPVLHPHDSAERMADARYAAALHCARAVVRLNGPATDLDDEAAEQFLRRVRDHAGLGPEACDLVLDMAAVQSDRELTRLEPIARKRLAWAQRNPWRSVTVAAGAMAESIAHLPTQAATRLRRWDAALWERIQEAGVQYGDYGTAHPRMTSGGRRPAPNLRYTTDDAWWIYRWPERESGHAMRRLCETVIASPQWPAAGAAFSWGDQEIARCAAGHAGPGNPSNWRAWSTSHHLAQVVSRLNHP